MEASGSLQTFGSSSHGSSSEGTATTIPDEVEGPHTDNVELSGWPVSSSDSKGLISWFKRRSSNVSSSIGSSFKMDASGRVQTFDSVSEGTATTVPDEDRGLSDSIAGSSPSSSDSARGLSGRFRRIPSLRSFRSYFRGRHSEGAQTFGFSSEETSIVKDPKEKRDNSNITTFHRVYEYNNDGKVDEIKDTLGVLACNLMYAGDSRILESTRLGLEGLIDNEKVTSPKSEYFIDQLRYLIGTGEDCLKDPVFGLVAAGLKRVEKCKSGEELEEKGLEARLIQLISYTDDAQEISRIEGLFKMARGEQVLSLSSKNYNSENTVFHRVYEDEKAGKVYEIKLPIEHLTHKLIYGSTDPYVARSIRKELQDIMEGKDDEHGEDAKRFRQDLRRIILSTLSGPSRYDRNSLVLSGLQRVRDSGDDEEGKSFKKAFHNTMMSGDKEDVRYFERIKKSKPRKPRNKLQKRVSK
jgi:hypothetical protein